MWTMPLKSLAKVARLLRQALNTGLGFGGSQILDIPHQRWKPRTPPLTLFYSVALLLGF